MRRIIIITLAILILLLVGCEPNVPLPSHDPVMGNTVHTQPSTVPSQPATTSTPTSATSEGPQTTVPASTGATAEDPPATDPAPTDAPSEDHYQTTPSRYIIFTYDGKKPNKHSALFYANVDVSGCEVGQFYEYDRVTQKLRLIAEDIRIFIRTLEHFYYCYLEDFTKLYRSAYGKTEDILVIETEAPISGMDYHGVNALGKLLVVEDDTKVWLYDLQAGTKEFLMEQYHIEPTIAYWANWSSSMGKIRYAIHWHGMATKDDRLTTYVYYLDTKENTIPPWG